MVNITMSCRLYALDTVQLLESMLPCYELDFSDQISLKFESKCYAFFKKMHRKCLLRNDGNFPRPQRLNSNTINVRIFCRNLLLARPICDLRSVVRQ